MCLVPIRGWPHRVTRASNCCAGGGALSVVEPSLSLRGGGWGEVFAVGAKLRRVGPMTTASGACCIAGARDAAVVWAGGLHSGWNARMRTGWGSARRFRQREGSVPPFGEQFSSPSGFLGEKKNARYYPYPMWLSLREGYLQCIFCGPTVCPCERLCVTSPATGIAPHVTHPKEISTRARVNYKCE